MTVICNTAQHNHQVLLKVCLETVFVENPLDKSDTLSYYLFLRISCLQSVQLFNNCCQFYW